MSGNFLRAYLAGEYDEVPSPPETLPIVEREGEREPVVPADLDVVYDDEEEYPR